MTLIGGEMGIEEHDLLKRLIVAIGDGEDTAAILEVARDAEKLLGMDTKGMDRLPFPKGTLIHVKGIPFELYSDVEVLGLKTNWDLVA